MVSATVAAAVCTHFHGSLRSPPPFLHDSLPSLRFACHPAKSGKAPNPQASKSTKSEPPKSFKSSEYIEYDRGFTQRDREVEVRRGKKAAGRTISSPH